MPHLRPRAHRRALLLPIAFALAATISAAPAAAQGSTAAKSAVTVHWLGHAAFEVVSAGGTRILIDPFLTGNPTTPDSLKQLARYGGANKPAAILVSHSHSDHTQDVKAIATAGGVPVVGPYEWVQTLGLPDSLNRGGNVGGTMKFGDVTVHLVPAVHSSDPGGRPLGFVLEFADGRTLYHTGDTWVFGDMALIEELYHPSILLFGVGGGPYGQDPKTAAFAIRKYFHPTTIVPMHYGTFPGLATDAEVRAAFSGDQRVVIMTPGQSRTF